MLNSRTIPPRRILFVSSGNKRLFSDKKGISCKNGYKSIFPDIFGHNFLI